MKTALSLLILLVVSLYTNGCQNSNSGSSKGDSGMNIHGYELVWNDEFDYEGLPDSTKWSYDTEGNEEGWGNSEWQHYTDSRIENARVENGSLFITARKETYQDKEYTSARLISRTHWKYGRVEVMAKLPPARGTWSAIWMMPGNWSFDDGGWPDVGEIDIMEHVGYQPGIIHASAHSKDYHYEWQNETQKTATIEVPDATGRFHAYSMEWTPEVMKAYVDDSLYFEYVNEGLGESKWPYDKPFYLIMNVAVGGSWGSVMGVDQEAFPQSMEVDYVRIYKKSR